MAYRKMKLGKFIWNWMKLTNFKWCNQSSERQICLFSPVYRSSHNECTYPGGGK